MKTVNQKYTNGGLLKYFLKGSLWLFIICIVSSLITAFLSLVIPEIISFTIDCVLGTKAAPDKYADIIALLGGLENLKRNIWIIAVAIIVIAAVSMLFRYGGTYFNTRANQVLMRRMRNELFSHIQRLPLSWHNEHRTGDIIQRCTSDADTISNFISNQLVSLFKIILLLGLSLAFMFITNVKLAAIASAFIPLLLGYSVFFYAKAKKHFKKCDEEEGVLYTLAQENLTGVRVVKAFGRERFERDKFENQNTYYTGLWVRLEKFMALYWASSDFLAALQLMFIIVLGTVFCVNGELSTGELVKFISYNTMMIGPVRNLGRIISNLSKSGVSLGRIAEIMNAEEEVLGENEGAISGDIVFDNVSFCYEEGKPVLSGVSFTVKEGQTLGIIGGTGSGKSTLGLLLDRLYDVTEGKITIGGRDIKDIPPATLRNSVGLILQEGYIYSRTVAENIGIAAENCGMEEVREAAETACVASNIDGFANGYETVVGERGVTLSGGQKQRVAIARTLIRQTPYIVFDDSLSAVDSDTDAKIRENLSKSCEGVTTVIISHRITTVMHADNIIVLNKGKIVECGTNDELLKTDGLYKKIYDIQTSLPDDLKKEAAHD